MDFLPNPVKEPLNIILTRAIKPVMPFVKTGPIWVLLFLLFVVLILVFHKRLWKGLQSFVTRLKSLWQAKQAKGMGKLTILISPFHNDPGQEVTQRLATALQENFGLSIDVVLLPQREQLILPAVGNQNEEKRRLRRKATKLLHNRHGDLLFWGEVSEQSLRLYMDRPTADKLPSKVYDHDRQSLTLPKDLPPDIRVAISALVIHWTSSVTDSTQSGFPQADTLMPLLQKLRHLLDNIPDSLHGIKGHLHHSKALLAYCIGEETGNNALLEEAITAYHETLKECTRDRAPLDWTTTQNNLGATLQALGRQESSTKHLKEAIIAYKAAMKECTRKRRPLDWAMTQYNLGNALRTLGERENTTTHLKEAITAYHEALKERTRERVALQWAMTQNGLGTALSALGIRENDTKQIHQGITAYSKALKECTRKQVPLKWAMVQNNLGLALSILGTLENNTQYLHQAKKAYQNALAVFEESGAPYYIEHTKGNIARLEGFMLRRD